MHEFEIELEEEDLQAIRDMGGSMVIDMGGVPVRIELIDTPTNVPVLHMTLAEDDDSE